MFVFASPEVAHAGIFTDFLADAGNAILSFFGLLVWAAGVLLNYAILANLNIAGFVTDQTGVKAAWTIIRDLANIGFIFILLFIGIAMILRLDGYNTKKLLATLIIAALLVNFSMFFAKVVIDVSNAFALEFYEAVSAPCNGNKDILNCLDNGISDRFMQNLKLTTIFNLEGDTGISGFTKLGNTESGFLDAEEINKGNKTGANIELNAGNIFLITFLGSIFLLITAFVFFAVSILFVIRFIALIILITLSPIGIAAFALPATAQYGSKWWKALFQYSFFAPVYLLFTYIIFKFMDSLTRDFGAEKSMFTAIIKGDSGSVGIIFNFLVITSLMLASLLLARHMGIKGGDKMVGLGNTLRKWGQGAVGRNVLGRPGAIIQQKINQASSKIKESRTGRNVLRGLGVATAGLYPGAVGAVRGAAGKAASSKFGSGRSQHETIEAQDKQIDIEVKRRTSNPHRLAGYFMGLKEKQQRRIYTGMKPRNRAALNKAMIERFGRNKGARKVEQLERRLPVDEREKTEEITRKSILEQGNRERRSHIERITSGQSKPNGKPYTDYEVREYVRSLSDSNTRYLSNKARKNKNIIQNLRVDQLKDLVKEGNLQTDEINTIRGIVIDGSTYTNQESHKKYMEDPANRALWGVEIQTEKNDEEQTPREKAEDEWNKVTRKNQ